MKDAHYYRELLYKSELKNHEIREIKKNQKSWFLKFETQQNLLIKLLKVIIFMQILNFINYYQVKEIVSYFNYNDYSGSLFYLWESYRKQLQSVFNTNEYWKNFM